MAEGRLKLQGHLSPSTLELDIIYMCKSCKLVFVALLVHDLRTPSEFTDGYNFICHFQLLCSISAHIAG
jgi:hypothetical protein